MRDRATTGRRCANESKRSPTSKQTTDTTAGSRELWPFARSGQIGLKELTDNGEETFVRSPGFARTATPTSPATTAGTTTTGCPLSTGTIWSAFMAPTTTRRKFNRTENGRPISAGDDDFARLYPRRNDAESINRHLDDTLWCGAPTASATAAND